MRVTKLNDKVCKTLPNFVCWPTNWFHSETNIIWYTLLLKKFHPKRIDGFLWGSILPPFILLKFDNHLFTVSEFKICSNCLFFGSNDWESKQSVIQRRFIEQRSNSLHLNEESILHLKCSEKLPWDICLQIFRELSSTKCLGADRLNRY